MDMFGLRQRILPAFLNIGMFMRMTWFIFIHHIIVC